MIRHFIERRRQQIVSRNIVQSFPHLPASLHSSVFPLYNPFCVDVLAFWSIPSQHRFGHAIITGLTLGARHAAMNEVIESPENTKVKRSMFAETEREKIAILESIRNSEWNAEMDPLFIAVQGQAIVKHDFSRG